MSIVAIFLFMFVAFILGATFGHGFTWVYCEEKWRKKGPQ